MPRFNCLRSNNWTVEWEEQKANGCQKISMKSNQRLSNRNQMTMHKQIDRRNHTSGVDRLKKRTQETDDLSFFLTHLSSPTIWECVRITLISSSSLSIFENEIQMVRQWKRFERQKRERERRRLPSDCQPERTNERTNSADSKRESHSFSFLIKKYVKCKKSIVRSSSSKR